eukprot:172220-Amphidinium_carterae.1
MSRNDDLELCVHTDQYGAMRNNASRTTSPRSLCGLPGAQETNSCPLRNLVEMAQAMIVTTQTSADGARARAYEMRQ